MKRTCILLLYIGFALSTFAVIATPNPVTRRLPDGSTQTVYLHGDEYCHWLTTLDGQLIAGTHVFDSTLILAREAENVSLLRRKPNAMMLTSHIPHSGIVRVPVVLVSFKDVAFTMENANANFADLFNGNGGTNPYSTGSVHTYFDASSAGQLNLIYDVYGPYTVSHDMDYYGANSGSSHHKNISALVIEAAQLASKDGVDFAPYDNNSDGYVDNLSIIAAGYNEAEGASEDAIWPHYSTISSSEKFSGKKIKAYLITSEYRSSGGSVQAGIGTYCHEFGHALGLPDLYNTQSSDTYTVGTWDIMCSGSYNNNGCTPPTYTAFERFTFDWLKPIQLTQSRNYVLPPIETDNTAYLIATQTHNLSGLNPSPTEYFLMENRQLKGWDANREALVGTGMMVTHITFNSGKWNNNTFNNDAPLGFCLVSACTEQQSTSTPADLFPGTTKVTTWLPKMNDETQLTEQMVTNIRLLGDSSIAFHYGVNSDQGFFFSPDQLSTLTTTFDKKIYHYDTAKVLVTIRDIDSDSIVIYSSSNRFDLSFDNGQTWLTDGKKKLMKALQDTTYTLTILIRHEPYHQACSITTAYLVCMTTDEVYINQLQIQGTSPRPTYITKPTPLGATNLTSTSFTANWESQEDAEYYYTTLYSISDTAGTLKQSFTTFTSIDNITAAGWNANFARINKSLSTSGAAVYFSESGQYLRSETYFSALTELNFWLSNNYSENGDTIIGGKLLIEVAPEDLQWTKLDEIRVRITTKSLDKSYTLDAAKQYAYVRFTYTHLGGSGGLVLDEYAVKIAKTLNFICRDAEIAAPTCCCIFGNLQPATSYYFSVKAYEDKGCTEHYSAPSDLMCITTTTTPSEKLTLTVTRDEEGVYYVGLPESASGNSSLLIFDTKGYLVSSTLLPYGSIRIPLPTDGLVPQNHYLLKLVEKSSLTRKDASGKVYYNPMY